MERMAEEASLKAEEAATKAEEKKPKTSVRKTARSRKAAPAQKRMKFIWQVLDEKSREIALFPYREKDEADARAAELSEKTGKTHTVDRIRVPMEDDE
jgi:hypothetical protein